MLLKVVLLKMEAFKKGKGAPGTPAAGGRKRKMYE
jgi:hypothetical protein